MENYFITSASNTFQLLFLLSLQAFSYQLMQQMADPVKQHNISLALTSILTGLLLILHITNLLSQPEFLGWIWRYGSMTYQVRLANTTINEAIEF